MKRDLVYRTAHPRSGPTLRETAFGTFSSVPPLRQSALEFLFDVVAKECRSPKPTPDHRRGQRRFPAQRTVVLRRLRKNNRRRTRGKGPAALDTRRRSQRRIARSLRNLRPRHRRRWRDEVDRRRRMNSYDRRPIRQPSNHKVDRHCPIL